MRAGQAVHRTEAASGRIAGKDRTLRISRDERFTSCVRSAERGARASSRRMMRTVHRQGRHHLNSVTGLARRGHAWDKRAAHRRMRGAGDP